MGVERNHIDRSVQNRVLELLRECLEHLGDGKVRYKHGNDETIAEHVQAERNVPVTVSNVRGLREKEFGKIRKQSARKLPPTPVPEPATTDTELRDQVAALQQLVATLTDAIEGLKMESKVQTRQNVENEKRFRAIERKIPAQQRELT